MMNLLKQKWSRRSICAALIGLVFMLMAIFGAGLYFRVSSWKDFSGYFGMCMESPPIWKDLALQRVQVGDRLEKFTNVHRPAYTRTMGPYKIHTFVKVPPGCMVLSDLSITSKNGKIVQAAAWSCTWQYMFCSDPGEQANIRAEYQKQYIKLRKAGPGNKTKKQ